MKLNIVPVVVALISSLSAFGQEVPKADLFFGYSFLRYNSAQTVPAFTANGGIGTFALNFSSVLGLEAELGGYHNGNINNHEFDTTTFSYLFGPRISINRSKTVIPYFHALFGGQNAHTSIDCSKVVVINPLSGTSCLGFTGRISRDQNNFAMAIGGGLDIKVTKGLLLRPIQLDYYLTRFQAVNVTNPTGPSTNRNQNNLRYAAGIAFNFGGERAGPPPPPPPPPAISMKPCPGGTSVPANEECPRLNMSVAITVVPNAVCPGSSARVAAAANLPQGATTIWTVGGETISQSPSFEFGAAGRAPGPYRIGLRATADGYNDASAETTVTVLNYVPPSGTLSATPVEIFVGETAALAANFRAGQCGGTLGPAAFTTPEGSIRGNQFDSTGVRFDPPGATEQRKTITVTAKVSDERGSGSAEGAVVVKQRAALGAQRLPDVVFAEGSDRINNCGKRVLLEDLKNRFEADPGGRVVFVGHVAQSELASTGLDLKRALNGAAVISAGTGVCTKFPASQVLVNRAGAADNGVDFQPYFCGTSAAVAERLGRGVQQSEDAKYRRVEVWFVPTGGMLPASAKDAKDASALGVGSVGCPR